MIELDVYSVGTAVILGCAGVELAKNWWYGHELRKEFKEAACEMMKRKGYEIHLDNYNTPYFVKGDIRYSFDTVHNLASEDRLDTIQ